MHSLRLNRSAKSVAAACGALLFSPLAQAQTPTDTLALELGKILTFFVLTLGPFTAIRPFVSLTSQMTPDKRRSTALATTGISLLAVFSASTVGGWILARWGISTGALLITAGIILFLVALNSIRSQYSAETKLSMPHGADGNVGLVAYSIAFPYIVSPYGIAVVILVFSTRPASVPLPATAAMLFGIMLVNCLVMLIAHRIARSMLLVPALAITASVLAVLQAALGIQAVMFGMSSAGIF